MNITLILFLLTFLPSSQKDSIHNNISSDKWKFESTPVWSEEFNYSGLPDTSKWILQTGGDGWGNNELQYYTSIGNAYVNDGVLKITALLKKRKERGYTSARIITKHKAEWKYGRVEVRMKLPKGRGTWPAVWMLPAQQSDNAVDGEIDIMEHVGYDQDKVHFSVHTKANNAYSKNEKTSAVTIANASEEFHTYRMDWAPYGIKGFVDDEEYFEYPNEHKGNTHWPFNKKYFMIINLAIGGDWGGAKGIDKKIFPAEMEVDYVRVYKFLE